MNHSRRMVKCSSWRVLQTKSLLVVHKFGSPFRWRHCQFDTGHRTDTIYALKDLDLTMYTCVVVYHLMTAVASNTASVFCHEQLVRRPPLEPQLIISNPVQGRLVSCVVMIPRSCKFMWQRVTYFATHVRHLQIRLGTLPSLSLFLTFSFLLCWIFPLCLFPFLLYFVIYLSSFYLSFLSFPLYLHFFLSTLYLMLLLISFINFSCC
jgi:hypothetical protein